MKSAKIEKNGSNPAKGVLNKKRGLRAREGSPRGAGGYFWVPFTTSCEKNN